MRYVLLALVCLVVVYAIPHRVCARQAPKFFEGDREAVAALGQGTARWIDEPLSFRTGSTQFDGEWNFGSLMMAAMGYGQVALEHHDASSVLRMDACLARMMEPSRRTFDTDRWGNDALETLVDGDGHVAFLGYANLALSLRRRIGPDNDYAKLNDDISRALEQRLQRSLLIESFPNEIYPVDISAGVASLALRARALGKPQPAVVTRWLAMARNELRDPGNGLLFQSTTDRARGSGTALAVYFLAYADLDLSRELFDALEGLGGSVLGFGVMREHPTAESDADIDSGPVVFGYGVSATGFALAGARIHDRKDLFEELFATAWLFGAPLESRDRLELVTGGPIGNAILFAMLTAPRRGPR